MNDIARIESNPRLSRVVVHNGIAWLSGIVASDCTGGIADQTRQVLARLDELLDKAGSSRSRVLSAQIWLKDMVADFDTMNQVWAEWFKLGEAPSRATCQVIFDEENIRIELLVVGALL